MGKKISSVYNFIKRSFKNYTFFGLYLLSRPKLFSVALKGIYLPQYLQYEWMKKFKINTFIDIGALDGNVSQVINFISPQTTIYAFEPIKGKDDFIKSKIKSKNFTIEPMALSNHIGIKDFYEYDFPAASSFLKPDPKVFKNYIHVAKNYPVKITTLDRYFEKKKLKKPIFIKMDTEGTENFIIQGGRKLLKQATFIVIETGFMQVRTNQCLFDEIYVELTKLGFVYKGSMFDSYFYPLFGVTTHQNSIFIKKGELLNYLQK